MSRPTPGPPASAPTPVREARTSGWVFAVRNRWYGRLVTRTPLVSLAIIAATAAGLWLLAVEVELTRFTTAAATVQGDELRGTAPLAAVESAGRDGGVLWRPVDGRGPPRTARLIGWERSGGESAAFVARIAAEDRGWAGDRGVAGDATVDFPAGVETIAQRLSARVLGRIVER